MPQFICSHFYKKTNEKQIIAIDFIISLFNTLVFDRKKVREKGVISKILNKIDIKSTAMADIVYTDTKVQAKNFEKEFKIDKKKFKVLYLEANTKVYNKKVGKISMPKDEFIVLWFGTVLPLQGVDIIIKSAKELSYNKNIKFYIIGNTNKLNIKRNEFKNIKFLGWQQDDLIAKYIKSADVCLAGHFALENLRANREIPGKAFVYKSMGKKMILGESEANREIFKEDNKTIFYVDRGNYKKLAKMIEKIYMTSL